MSSSGYADNRSERDPGLAGAAAVLLGILVAVLGFFALMMWVDARHARDAADRAAASVTGSMPGMDMSSSASAGWLHELCGSSARQCRRARHRSQAVPCDDSGGTSGGNGRGRESQAHRPHGPDRARREVLGVGVGGWRARPGHPRAPGPDGQDHVTNNGAIPHSVDFHAARIAPDKAFTDVMPDQSVSYTFRANDPGVFMYHCGTKPVLMHIANGMYGAIVVEPRAGVLPKGTGTTCSWRASGTSRRTGSTSPPSSTWPRHMPGSRTG